LGTRTNAALTVGALVASLAAFSACKKGGADWRILQLYSGETSVDLLAHPSKVQAFRVAAAPRAPKTGETHAGPFIATAPIVDVPADAAAELSATLSDADAYDWRRGPKPFAPQIGLAFVRGAYVLEAALDLDTAQIRVFAGDQPLGSQSIAPSRARFLAVAKRLFKDDAAVQSMK
jgi:hypothetical protein